MFSSSFVLLAILSDWGIFALRIAVAAILLAHGIPKIKNLKRTQDNFSAMGFRPGVFWGTLVSVVEVFGGIALLLGLYTQIIAGIFMGEFATIIIWRILRKHHFVGGWELDVLILAAILVLFTIGGGVFSLDRWLFLTGF